jgi:hypothetical protein
MWLGGSECTVIHVRDSSFPSHQNWFVGVISYYDIYVEHCNRHLLPTVLKLIFVLEGLLHPSQYYIVALCIVALQMRHSLPDLSQRHKAMNMIDTGDIQGETTSIPRQF